MNPNEEWLTTPQAVQLTGYSKALITHLAREGRINAYKVGRDWLINRQDLLDYQQKMQQKRKKRGAKRKKSKTQETKTPAFSLENLITTSEAAEISGYTAHFIRTLAGQGRIEAVKKGKIWLIRRDSLLAYCAEMKQKGTAKHSPSLKKG